MRILWGVLLSSLFLAPQAIAVDTYGALGLSAGVKPSKYTIAVFGDDLSSGYGLSPEDAFPAQLEQKLTGDGYTNVKVINDSVNESKTADAMSRVQSLLLQHPNIVILELGSNDLQKKLPPAEIKKNLDEIMDRFKRAKVDVFLTGLTAPPSLGTDYDEAFSAVYADLAKDYGATYYPDFLDGANGILGLMQPDGIHPSREGMAVIANSIGGKLEYELKK